MINTTNTGAHTNSYDEVIRFATANGAIIVHPNQNIIAKVVQKLQKTK